MGRAITLFKDNERLFHAANETTAMKQRRDTHASAANETERREKREINNA
jgi:hypothetical protein